MTQTNIYGPAVSWRDLKAWAVKGAQLWLPDYLADSERQHGLIPPQAGRPKAGQWTTATSPTKWAQITPPCIVVISPGMVGDEAPRKQADRTYQTTWGVRYLAIVHGRDEDDTDLLASVYGLAIRQMVNQQAGAWTGATGYTGPQLTVEEVRWVDEGYDEIAAARRRTLVAATVTFSIVLRNTATTLGGPDQPTQTPTVDPGPAPEITSVELDTTREAIA
jgi:hypothetical protein